MGKTVVIISSRQIYSVHITHEASRPSFHDDFVSVKNKLPAHVDKKYWFLIWMETCFETVKYKLYCTTSTVILV